jgi:hypothetical protein
VVEESAAVRPTVVERREQAVFRPVVHRQLEPRVGFVLVSDSGS